MKKLWFLLGLGLLCLALSSVLYAQDSTHTSFAGGGYTGPSLEAITIADLKDATPNTYVIVTGTIAKQKVPGKYVLVDGEGEDQVSVLVRIGPYEWSNVQVDDATQVAIYGIILKLESSIEILADRIDLLEQ